MGMYTKVNLILPIKKETNKNILNIIIALFEGDGLYDLIAKNLNIPEHEFFKENNKIWFPDSGGSYSFTGTVNSRIRYDNLNEYAMVLHIDTDFKNYNNEINKFLDWIEPYIDLSDDTFLGYSLYEEFTNPTLYFYKDNKIISYQTNCIGE